MTFTDTHLDAYEGTYKAWDALHEWMHSKGIEVDAHGEQALCDAIKDTLVRCQTRAI